MEALTLVFIFVVILIVVKLIGSFNRKDVRRPPSALNRSNWENNKFPDRRRQTPVLTTSYTIPPKPTSNENLKTIPNLGDTFYKSKQFQRAFEEYNKENKIFNAALSLARLGPDRVMDVIDYLNSKNPSVLEVTVSNLVQQLYNKYGEVSTSAALYRAIGRTDEAMAIEVANNIPPTEKYVTSRTSQSGAFIPVDNAVTKQETRVQQDSSIKPEISTSRPKSQTIVATSSLSSKCMICNKEIRAGDTYVSCPNCGAKGHKPHVLEWAKAIGKCKNCKEHISMSDFNN